MNELEKELQESIKKNLPQQVGDLLKQRLEQADRDAKDLLTEKKSVDNLTNQVATLLNTLEGYKQFDERNALLDARQKNLEERENKYEIEQLKFQLGVEKEKTAFSQSLAMGIVRNTEYRKTIFDSETANNGMPIIDGQGHAHYPLPVSKSFSETRVEE